jgi:hypothetical protein
VTWLDEEPRLTSVAKKQVRRLAGRALRRPAVMTIVALVISAGLFALQSRRPTLHTRGVRLLITEGAFASDGRPRPRGELLGFIDRAVFTTSHLGEIVTKHDLVRKLRARTLGRAIDRLREGIDVGIWQDFFAENREGSAPPRTVRVTIDFSAPDPETALAVARDLGQLVAETQTQREADAAAELVKKKRILADSAAARANAMHEELERMKLDALERPDGNAYVGLQRMRDAVYAADAASAAIAGALLDAQLRERSVRRVGHLVQVIDPGTPLWQTMSRAERLTGQAAVSLGVGVLLAVFVVGALDPAIRDDQDLRRVSMPCLGEIRARSDETAS